MASIEEVQEQLLDDIVMLSKQASGSSHTPAEKYASAARQLAEAHAWLISSAQSHGGNTTSSA